MKKGYAKALGEITEAIQKQEALNPPVPPAPLPPAVMDEAEPI